MNTAWFTNDETTFHHTGEYIPHKGSCLIDREVYSCIRRLSCIREYVHETSDIEESDDEKIDDLGSLSGGAYYTSEGTFRSPWNCQVMHFSISRDQNSKQNHLNLPMGRGDFIYESLLVIWLRVWQNQDRHTKKINLQTGSSSSLKYSFLLPSFSGNSQVHDSTLKFFDHLDILMPLCLKSIILRYSSKVQDTK